MSLKHNPGKLLQLVYTQQLQKKMKDQEVQGANNAAAKKKRNRRRRKPRTSAKTKSEKSEKQGAKTHDAPMTKRDLYFTLSCELVTIGQGASAVARVTMLNWDAEVVLDTHVQVPVPVTDFRSTGITPSLVSSSNSQAMTFAKVRLTVYQTLKGKILVGHNLQEHLSALGLTHPSTDVRDTASFELFRYEEIDGVTDEHVVVDRPLEEMAGEFLQRSYDHPLNPVESSTVALDLYKAFRKEWEEYLIQKSQQKENFGRMHESFTSYSTDAEARPRLPSYDLSVSSYGEPGVHEQGLAWGGNVEQATSQPALTSQALEVLNYQQGAPAAIAFGNAPMYHAAYNYTSSTYYEDSSAMSDSYATGSITSSHHEDLHFQQHAHAPAPSASNSWFRFGQKRQYYPPPPMASLTEELDATTFPPEPSQVPADKNLGPYNHGNVGASEEKQSSSWFGFRRPKSPKVGLRRPNDSDDEQEAASTKRPASVSRMGSLIRRDSTSSAGCRSSVGSSSIRADQVVPITEEPAETEKQSGSWFSFRRTSKTPSILKKQASDIDKSDKLQTSDETSLGTSFTEPVEEDWLREVVGSPNTQKKDVLASSWLENNAMVYELPLEPAAQQPPTKESSWAARFLRAKPAPATATTRVQWLDSSVADQNVLDKQHYALNPSFFASAGYQSDEASLSANSMDVASGSIKGPTAARSRLETEATIPTVASEAEEDDGTGSWEEDKSFTEGMEQNFSFLNI